MSLSLEEKKSFDELLSFCTHTKDEVRLAAVSTLLNYIKIEAYIKHLRYTVRVLETTIKVLVQLISDSESISRMAIACLIVISQDQSTLFTNEMVKNGIVQVLMTNFNSLYEKEVKNVPSNKYLLESILLLLSNLTANSEQARLKFLNMKTIEDTLRKLKKFDSDSDDSDDDDTDSSDSEDESDDESEQEANISMIFKYFNRNHEQLRVSIVASHLLPTILANITVNDHAKHSIVKYSNETTSYLHFLLFKNLNINMLSDKDIVQDKCLRRSAILSLLKNCLFDRSNIASILYVNRSSENEESRDVIELLLYQLTPKLFPNYVQLVASECLIMMTNTGFGLEHVSQFIERIKLLDLKTYNEKTIENMNQLIYTIENKDAVKPGSIVQIDENGNMVNLNSNNTNNTTSTATTSSNQTPLSSLEDLD